MTRALSLASHALVISVLLGSGSAAHAIGKDGYSADATASASAQIIAPITLVTVRQLDFGSVGSRTAGTVQIDPSDVQTFTGGAASACITTRTNTCPVPGAARFTVSGEPLRSYRITLPASLTASGVATRANQIAAPLTVNALVARTASQPGSGNIGTLNASGQDSFAVGGTLIVPANIVPARYAVAVPVNVAYD